MPAYRYKQYKWLSLGKSVSLILHFIAPNARNSSELHSPACRVGEMFYSFVIHKSVWSSGLCKEILWWNCSTAASVYATINLLICPQGHARELLRSSPQLRNTRVERDKGNIMAGRYKWGVQFYITRWVTEIRNLCCGHRCSILTSQPVAEDRRGLGDRIVYLKNMWTK